MRAAKVQASLRIRAVSPEPPLLAHTSSESRGTFRQKARSLASLNGWACAVKTCRDGMLEDTNSLDGAQSDKDVQNQFLGSFPTTDNKRCPYSCHSIRPVWSESLLCAQCVAKDPSFLHADSEDSDQTGRSILPTFSILCLYLPDLFFYLH